MIGYRVLTAGAGVSISTMLLFLVEEILVGDLGGEDSTEESRGVRSADGFITDVSTRYICMGGLCMMTVVGEHVIFEGGNSELL